MTNRKQLLQLLNSYSREILCQIRDTYLDEGNEVMAAGYSWLIAHDRKPDRHNYAEGREIWEWYSSFSNPMSNRSVLPGSFLSSQFTREVDAYEWAARKMGQQLQDEERKYE